ncbi:MAG TPA: CDP-alcohol phosphatidyltransferase family protein [Candidatus Babeliales bacterium]|nr:CDP-alcohol phosphatidyltransferase family protein [Candidatus Babeliales bacterium]
MRFSLSRIKKLFQKISLGSVNITLSTYITLSRIFLIPFIVAAMILGHWGWALILFLIAALTDLLDGFLARLLSQQSFLGACLDPLADKALVLSCFITLACIEDPTLPISKLFVFFVLIKEILQILGVIALFYLQGFVHIKPTMTAKISMWVQALFIFWVCACYLFRWMPLKSYRFILSIVVVSIFLSFIQYVYIGYKALVRNYGSLR